MAVTVNDDASLGQPSFGETLSRLSHIPFWGRYQTEEKAYETTFQQDFKSFASLTKRAAIHHSSLAKVEHKDLQHIRKYETEVASSFTTSPLIAFHLLARSQHGPNIPPIWKCWTQAESFQHRPTLSAVPRPVRLFLAASMKQGDDKLPETTRRVLCLVQCLTGY